MGHLDYLKILQPILKNPMHFWLQHYIALAIKAQELFMQTIYNMDQEYLSKLL